MLSKKKKNSYFVLTRALVDSLKQWPVCEWGIEVQGESKNPLSQKESRKLILVFIKCSTHYFNGEESMESHTNFFANFTVWSKSYLASVWASNEHGMPAIASVFIVYVLCCRTMGHKPVFYIEFIFVNLNSALPRAWHRLWLQTVMDLNLTWAHHIGRTWCWHTFNCQCVAVMVFVHLSANEFHSFTTFVALCDLLTHFNIWCVDSFQLFSPYWNQLSSSPWMAMECPTHGRMKIRRRSRNWHKPLHRRGVNRPQQIGWIDTVRKQSLECIQTSWTLFTVKRQVAECSYLVY